MAQQLHPQALIPQEQMYTKTFNQVLKSSFTLRYPEASEWLNKLWYAHTMEYCLAI